MFVQGATLYDLLGREVNICICTGCYAVRPPGAGGGPKGEKAGRPGQEPRNTGTHNEARNKSCK